MKRNPSIKRFMAMAMMIFMTSFSLQAQQLADKADVPRTISYQGLLTSSDGTPFADGQYEITVTLYSDGRGDSPVWQDNYLAEVTGGVFNVLIGSGNTALPSSENLSTPLWIGTSVNGAPEMRPLTPMTASPYALNVPDRAITTNKLAEKSVTAEKVDMDYISGLEIDGMPVSGKGAVLKLKSSEKIALTYDEVTQTVLIDEASHATGTTGDGKDATAQAGTNILWSDGGDTWTVTGGAASTPTAASWIGTRASAALLPFHIRTVGTPIMTYHTSAAGSDPNVQGGNGNTVAVASLGSTIAGGGGGSNITGDYDAIGGGFGNNISDGDFDVIGGGNANNIYDGDYNTLSGGDANNIGVAGVAAVPMYSTIGGGQANYLEGPYNTVSGGLDNQIYAGMATIGGGANNFISSAGREATIAGGHVNRIESYVGGITSGHDNTIGRASDFGFIGAGQMNTIQSSTHGTIGGGSMNTLNGGSDGSFIGGGMNNNITGRISTIGGGENHNITADEAVIAGGHVNTVESYAGSILGGHDNVVSNGSDFGTVTGGQGNVLNPGSMGSFIGGGTNNRITGPISTIGGGDGHIIDAPEATIAGGHLNRVEAYVGTVSGGHDNVVAPGGDAGYVGGGRANFVDAASGAISGGNSNLVTGAAPVSFIGGGEGNSIDAPYSVIGGGQTNNAAADYTTIGGGQSNNAFGSYTTIAGGDLNLTDPSYAQTIVGFYNAPRGAAVGVRPTAAVIAATDFPLFMVGNGDANAATGRSNAFEVSYNGHSTVFDNNGQGSAGLMRPAFRGARYEDNTVYAWGDIDATGGINDDFGVASVVQNGAGWYTVTLNYLDPITGVAQLSQLAVTATINDRSCAIIRVQVPTGPTNTFDVYIDDLSCNPVDLPFHFHVMGRP